MRTQRRHEDGRIHKLGWFALLTAITVLLFAGTAQTAPGEAENAGSRIVRKMLETYRSMTSFEQSSTHVTRMTAGGDRHTTNGMARFVYRKPNRFLHQITSQQEGISIVCDGKSLWIYSGARDQYTTLYAPQNLERARAVMGPWGESFMDAFAFMQGVNPLDDARSVRLVGSAKLRGVPVYIVELHGGPAGMGLSDSITRLYIGKQDSLLHKSETRQERTGAANTPGRRNPYEQASRVILQTHSFMKVNKPIPDQRFTFKPPPGAKQVGSL